MAERAAKIEADRRVELARQAAEFAQVEAGRKAEQAKIVVQERQRPSGKEKGPDFSR